MPDQAVWDAQEPDWLLDLIDYGEAAPAPAGPAPGNVREQLHLPAPRTATDAERAATRAKVLANLAARTPPAPE